jgi:integrase
MKRKFRLTDLEAEAILKTAQQKSRRDHLFLNLIGEARGLRIGEVVGVKKTTKYQAWVDKKHHEFGKEWRVSETDLPGIHAEDFRDGSVWLQRKGGAVKQIRLSRWLYDELIDFGRGSKGKLFDFRERRGYDVVQEYARLAGLKDYLLVHPHTWRHYFITRTYRSKKDLKATQQLAGHKSDRTTLLYIDDLTPEEESGLLEELSPEAH